MTALLIVSALTASALPLGAQNHVQRTLYWLGRANDPKPVNASFYTHAIVDHSVDVAVQPSTWSQRYYVDARFWCGVRCPVFLYIGGEGPQGPPSPRLFMWTLAKKHGALMLSLEHRFYGESRPTADLSVASLAHLTSSQALADLARFHSYISSYEPSVPDTKSSPPLRLSASPRASKWISFGGSYPGALATWLKAKYPALVAGTIGSSAPVFAKYDFSEYMQVVGSALGYEKIGGSSACVEAISAGAAALDALVSKGELMHKTVPAALRPCSVPNSTVDLSTFFANLMGNFQGVVQYNLEGRPPYVSDVCNAALRAGGKRMPLKALAAATALFSKNASVPACVKSSFQNDTLNDLANTTFSAIGCDLNCTSDRQWIWQSCNEFGYFQTGTATSQPFIAWGHALGIGLAGRNICEKAFSLKGYSGPRQDAAGLQALTQYGARQIGVPNITMPNGNMDPWHALSVVNSSDAYFEVGGAAGRQVLVDGVSVVELDGTGHCRDMYAPGAFEKLPVPIMDTPSVQWAHAKIAGDVARYLA